MLNYETNKMFYKKYLYKLDIRNSLAYSFREKNFTLARNTLDILQKDLEAKRPLDLQRGLRKQRISTNALYDGQKLLNIFTTFEGDFKLRVHYNSMSIYSNNEDWLFKISKLITKESLVAFHSPNPNYKQYLNEKTILIENDIGYTYKVTLGKKAGDPSFALWADKNTKQVKLGPILRQTLLDRGYVDNMYFYARDEKTLQLCNLMLSNIRSVDKLVVKANLDK